VRFHGRGPFYHEALTTLNRGGGGNSGTWEKVGGGIGGHERNLWISYRVPQFLTYGNFPYRVPDFA
jgi:hypothetical protein